MLAEAVKACSPYIYPQRVQVHRSGRDKKPELKTECLESLAIAQDFEGEYPQKSPQLAKPEEFP